MDAVGLRSRKEREKLQTTEGSGSQTWMNMRITHRGLKKKHTHKTDAWIPFPDNKILSVYGGPDKGIIFLKSDSTVQQGLEGWRLLF